MTKQQKLKRRLITLGVVVVLILGTLVGVYLSATKTAKLPTNDQAYALIDEAIATMSPKTAIISNEIANKSSYTVNSINQEGLGCVVNITVKTVDIVSYIQSHIDEITCLDEPDANGVVLKSDELKTIISTMVVGWMDECDNIENTIDVLLSDVDGKWQVYKSKDLSDAIFVGQYDFNQDNSSTEVKAIKRLLTLTDIKIDTTEPDTRNWVERSFDDVKAQFKLNFIEENRWMMIVNGLLTTLEITGVSLVIGVVVGVIVAAIRSSFDKNREEMERRGGVVYTLMSFLNGLCKVYLTVIRGTPVVVQVLIYYFIIFASVKNGTIVAMIAFGVNSGAYVAEIFRGGIMSIDNGQFEAGRSLGFNYVRTMWHIVIPQVFKAVLPTLCNEFIALLKETSIVGYVGEVDLTKAGDLIRGRTFSAFMPLIAVALVYLSLVMILTFLVGILERRLRKSER